MGMVRNGKGNASFFAGPGITANRTPLDDALACFGMAIRRAGKPPVGIAVGEVRDFTGKVTDLEGAQITQGGGLMVYSGIGKMGGAVRLHERLDPRIGEVELIYMDRRQLGDGRRHRARVGTQDQEVPWVPYYGGSIVRSDYFIVGGITELNQSITSGGLELGINLISGRVRAMVINVAADLRIVNTHTLLVERAVTLQKQVVGIEVGADIFRFFGTRLVDVNTGIKTLEPVQLAVRAVLELATMELLGAVTGVDHRECLPDVLRDPAAPAGSDPGGEEEAARKVDSEAYAVGRAAVAPVHAAPLPLPAPASPPAPVAQAPTPVDPAPVAAAAPAAAGERPRPPVPDAPAGAVRAPGVPRVEAPASAGDGAAQARPAPVRPGVMLAAMSSEAAARQGWTTALGRHADLLSPLEARVQRVQVQGRELWVVVATLPADASATALCDMLKGRGTDCAVAPPQLVGAREAPPAPRGG